MRLGGVGGTGPSSQPNLAYAVRDYSFANERAAERGGGCCRVGGGGRWRVRVRGGNFPRCQPRRNKTRTQREQFANRLI